MVKNQDNIQSYSSEGLKDGDYLNFLLSIRTYIGFYHNHKETMAWVALAVYLGTFLTLFTTIVIHKDTFKLILADQNLKMIFIIIMIVIESLLAIFIIWEFWYRRIASYIAAAYTTCVSKFLSGEITKNDFKKRKEMTFYFWKIYEHKSNYSVPRFIAEEYENICKKRKPLLNELISYILIAFSLSGLIAIMIINLF